MKVKDDCPKGYSREELVNIAKDCNIRLTRVAPLKGPKNMKELCEDIKKYKKPVTKGVVRENCPKGYSREELVDLSKSNGLRLTRIAPLKGYKNMVELCDQLRTVSVKRSSKRSSKRRSVAKRSSPKKSSKRRSVAKRSSVNKDLNKVKNEYFDFIMGPYLEFNMYAESTNPEYQTYEQLNALSKIKSFFKKGLRADTMINGKTVFELYIDSIIRGSRYALDDQKEVKSIINEMLKHGGKHLVRNIENELIKVIDVDENEYADEYMEDYATQAGLYVIGFLFYVFNTDMSRFYPDWNNLEADDDQPINNIGILKMLKFIMIKYHN
jgi:hypothetical protein